MNTTTTTEITDTDTAIAYLKKHWPALRRTASTAIIRSGSRRTIFGCLCGSEHTASTEWNGRDAKHVWEWRAEHGDCAVKLALAHQKGERVLLSFGR